MSATAEIDLEQLADLLADRLAERDRAPRLVDAETAAAAIGVKAQWLMAWARARRCPHRRLGKFVRFSIDELEAWADDFHGYGPKGGAR